MNIQVRDASAADYALFARLQPALGVPDPPLSATEFEERMLPDVIVACEGGKSIGYAQWRAYGATAHLCQIVVDADARGRGVGQKLMESLRLRALARACTGWYLNVKADNRAAIRLYERSGLAIEQHGWALRGDWTNLQQLAGLSDAVRFEPSLEDVTRFALEHRIHPERFALVRARPGVIFVAQRDHAGICAAAAFDPAFPGIYPIAVARPAHARALFAAFAEYAEAPQVNLFIEGNSALAAAVRATGAKLTFETLRMGALLA